MSEGQNKIDWSKGRPAMGDLDVDTYHRLCDALEAWAEDLGWRELYHGSATPLLQAMLDAGWDVAWLKTLASGFFTPRDPEP